MYNAEIWTSDKLKFSFWYPQDCFDDIYDEIKECLLKNRNEFFFGDWNITELHLEDWGKGHFGVFEEPGFSIPWAKVVMWNLCVSKLD